MEHNSNLKNKNYYTISSFVKRILAPCILVVVIIIFVMSLMVHSMDASATRFFITTITAEVMIIILGYLIVLDKNEKHRIGNLIQSKINHNEN